MGSKLLTWLYALHSTGDIVEIRSLSPKPVLSGYFKLGIDDAAIIEQISRYPDRTFYQTMNDVNPACYSRGQCGHIVSSPTETTSDNDIDGYQYILIDCDPERKSGISASNEEKSKALEVSRRVFSHMRKLGFSDPIVADSGNGYHLLYRVHITLEHKTTIQDFLKVMDLWFSTDEVKIDTAVFNPSRITKLYSTVSRKGADTEERPHRESAIISIPKPYAITSLQLVQSVAGNLAKLKPAMPETRHTGESFDAERFLAEHHISINRRIKTSDGTLKLILEQCPFDASHKAPDSAVFIRSDGAIGFRCLHNHCSDRTWRDLRMMLDPEAYNRDTSAYANKYTDFSKLHSSSSEQPDEDKGARMLDITEVGDFEASKVQVIKSRFASMDTSIGGFNKGQLSVWSGGNASGKSTLVSQLGLEAVHQGYRVALFSGEMTPVRVKYWLYLQAAGRDNVLPDTDGIHYCLKPGIREQLDTMLHGNFALYNNEYGLQFETVMQGMIPWVQENHADMLIIDNLMALETPSRTDKYEMQSAIVKELSQQAKRYDIHIHFICHPRKTSGFLRKEDISGTADLTNIADNVFIVHRCNHDFETRFKECYPKEQIRPDIGNVIEIAKNRDNGVSDEFIKLYFDTTCKTFSDIKGGKPCRWFEEELAKQQSIEADCPWGV